jgi:hypothetical protein
MQLLELNFITADGNRPAASHVISET